MCCTSTTAELSFSTCQHVKVTTQGFFEPCEYCHLASVQTRKRDRTSQQSGFETPACPTETTTHAGQTSMCEVALSERTDLDVSCGSVFFSMPTRFAQTLSCEQLASFSALVLLCAFGLWLMFDTDCAALKRSEARDFADHNKDPDKDWFRGMVPLASLQSNLSKHPHEIGMHLIGLSHLNTLFQQLAVHLVCAMCWCGANEDARNVTKAIVKKKSGVSRIFPTIQEKL